MTQQSAIAVAAEPSGLETVEQRSSLTAAAEMRIEDFQARIENEEKMRVVLKDYVKRNMKPGYHFSDKIGTQQLAKPMLLQDGCRNICSLFKLTYGVPDVYETQLEGGHYRVRVHIKLYNQQGFQVASGDATCSTRETKYAYRKGERVCPKCDTPAIRKDNKKAEGGWYCWSKLDGCGAQFPANEPAIVEQQIGRVDNPDVSDVENTVLKMAVKRAKSSAVYDVPLVSEIFAPDDDQQPEPPKSKAQSQKQDPQPQPKESVVDNVVGLAAKLTARGLEIEDLVVQFLPEGTARFEDLTDEQALAIQPAMVELLNAKLKEK